MTNKTSKHDGLIAAYKVGLDGTTELLGWDELDTRVPPEEGYIWIHLKRTDPQAQTWLRQESKLEPLVCEALLAEETRPRCTSYANGLIINLRGVNHNLEANPKDLISIRAWMEPGLVITTRLYKILAINDIRTRLESNSGPRALEDFLVDLADGMVMRLEGVITEIDETVDNLEEDIISESASDVRGRIAEVRRQAIALRRYIAPQREAMSVMASDMVPWIHTRHRARLREIADRVTRYIEDLDSARERAAVIHEEMGVRLSEQMNRTMYVLSIVATIFLPLGLLTGLLGINVGGMPGVDSPWAFWVVCGLMVVLGLIEMWLFRRKNLF